MLLPIFAALLYFLPAIIAASRHKRNTGGIFATNLFLGWTGIGWIVCLVWAVTEDTPLQDGSAVQYAPALNPEPGVFCCRCGYKNPAVARFCGRCGAAVSQPLDSGTIGHTPLLAQSNRPEVQAMASDLKEMFGLVERPLQLQVKGSAETATAKDFMSEELFALAVHFTAIDGRISSEESQLCHDVLAAFDASRWAGLSSANFSQLMANMAKKLPVYYFCKPDFLCFKQLIESDRLNGTNYAAREQQSLLNFATLISDIGGRASPQQELALQELKAALTLNASPPEQSVPNREDELSRLIKLLALTSQGATAETNAHLDSKSLNDFIVEDIRAILGRFAPSGRTQNSPAAEIYRRVANALGLLNASFTEADVEHTVEHTNGIPNTFAKPFSIRMLEAQDSVAGTLFSYIVRAVFLRLAGFVSTIYGAASQAQQENLKELEQALMSPDTATNAA